jgi:hypothetical protein
MRCLKGAAEPVTVPVCFSVSNLNHFTGFAIFGVDVTQWHAGRASQLSVLYSGIENVMDARVCEVGAPLN